VYVGDGFVITGVGTTTVTTGGADVCIGSGKRSCVGTSDAFTVTTIVMSGGGSVASGVLLGVAEGVGVAVTLLSSSPVVGSETGGLADSCRISASQPLGIVEGEKTATTIPTTRRRSIKTAMIAIAERNKRHPSNWFSQSANLIFNRFSRPNML